MLLRLLQLLPQPLLFATFVVVVVAAWFSPKRYRPWCRAAVMVGALGFAPRSSFLVFLAWTLFCVATAAFVLRTSGVLRSEWWRRYSDHKWTGRLLLSIDLVVAYVLFAILMLFVVPPIGGVLYLPVDLATHPSVIVRLVKPPPRPSVSPTRWVGDTASVGVPVPGPIPAPTKPERRR